MKHQKRVQKLNRTKSHKRALLQNLAIALFTHEKIKTTVTKAMALKRVAERLITLTKRKDTHSMRLAFAFLRHKETVAKLFGPIAERYAAINGGYTRVLKIGQRKGDNAPMAIIELILREEKEKKEEKGKKVKKVTKEKKGTKEKSPSKESKETKTPKKTKETKKAKEKQDKASS